MILAQGDLKENLTLGSKWVARDNISVWDEETRPDVISNTDCFYFHETLILRQSTVQCMLFI